MCAPLKLAFVATTALKSVPKAKTRSNTAPEMSALWNVAPLTSAPTKSALSSEVFAVGNFAPLRFASWNEVPTAVAPANDAVGQIRQGEDRPADQTVVEHRSLEVRREAEQARVRHPDPVQVDAGQDAAVGGGDQQLRTGEVDRRGVAVRDQVDERQRHRAARQQRMLRATRHEQVRLHRHQAGARQVDVGERRAGRAERAHPHVRERRRPALHQRRQLRTAQVRAREVGAAHVRAVQRRAAQAGIGEVPAGEAPGEGGAARRRAAEVALVGHVRVHRPGGDPQVVGQHAFLAAVVVLEQLGRRHHLGAGGLEVRPSGEQRRRRIARRDVPAAPRGEQVVRPVLAGGPPRPARPTPRWDGS